MPVELGSEEVHPLCVGGAGLRAQQQLWRRECLWCNCCIAVKKQLLGRCLHRRRPRSQPAQVRRSKVPMSTAMLSAFLVGIA